MAKTNRNIDFSISNAILNKDSETPEFPMGVEEIGSHGAEQFHVDYLKTKFADLSRPNLFKIGIHPPDTLKDDWGDTANGLLVLAKKVVIPSITVKEYVYERAGQRIHFPTNTVDFGDVNITFYSDSNYDLRTLFNRWQRFACVNWESNKGSIPEEMKGGTVVIYQYDYNYDPVYAVQLVRAWPQTLSEIELSQDSENSIGEFTVTFKYSYQKVMKS